MSKQNTNSVFHYPVTRYEQVLSRYPVWKYRTRYYMIIRCKKERPPDELNKPHERWIGEHPAPE